MLPTAPDLATGNARLAGFRRIDAVQPHSLAEYVDGVTVDHCGRAGDHRYGGAHSVAAVSMRKSGRRDGRERDGKDERPAHRARLPRSRRSGASGCAWTCRPLPRCTPRLFRASRGPLARQERPPYPLAPDLQYGAAPSIVTNRGPAMRYTALIVGAMIFFVSAAFVASTDETNADAATAGPYQIAAQANTGNVWQVDVTTGALRLCRPPREALEVARCGPWSQ